MRLEELVDLGVLQQLVEANYKANGRVIAVVDALDGSILVGMGWQRICTAFHRVHPVTASRCRASDAYIKRQAVEGTPCEYRCRNGLYDIGIPVLVGGEHLASVFFGQFFHQGEPIDREFFVQQARQFGFDEREYLAALDLVPVYDRATVDNVLQYNRALARLIADLAERALAQARYEGALHAAAEEAKAHARELELVLDTVPAAVFITHNQDARDMTVNRAGAEILGVGPGANVSMSAPLERHTTRFRAVRRGVVRAPEELPVQVAAREGLPVRNAELELEFDDGAVRHFIGNAAPLRGSDGEVLGAVGAFVDVTELRRAEEALRESNRRKDEFLAVLSHELRNPLAPIRNAVAVLQRAKPGSERAERARQVIDRQVAHISRLVDDLLDVSRIEQGKLRLIRERLCLRDLVRRTVDDHRSLFARRKIALVLEEGAQQWVEGDSTRLGQVIGNLLQNAAKFTDAGGHVAVTLDEEAEYAVFRVRDDGAGMDSETLDGLFLPFVQAEETLDRTLGGLGLGLSLAKCIVELHGGSIAASSDGLGRGSEFVVRLPLAQGQKVSPAPPAATVRGVRAHVLVVEDNEDSAATLADFLRLEGHQVSVAHDGREGLEVALAGDPDVVLCDLGLPGMDGYEVARRLRAGGSRARLVALTGYAGPEDVERARQAGFDVHLAKPPDLAKLLLAVEERAGGVFSL